MGLVNLLVPFLATWFGIHVFLFLLQRFLNRPNLPVGPGSGPEYELLPTVSATGGGQSGSGTGSKPGSSSSGLLIKPFNVRFSTTSLNSFFFRLGNSPKLVRFWRVWYNLGVVFGLSAMIVGWALLMLRKRNVLDDAEHTVETTRDSGDGNMVLIPMIPGVTLPISHLPYYLIALFVSGIYHEAGHAIAAAREKTQLRVVCAGVWHNVVLFAAAGIFLSSGLFQISLQMFGWKQMTSGVSVVSIAKSSALNEHLRVGSIVTRVNDILLIDNPLAVWESALLPPILGHGSSNVDKESGFCIPHNILFNKPSDCCVFTPDMPFGYSSDTSISCFTPYDQSTIELPPHKDEDGKEISRQLAAHQPLHAPVVVSAIDHSVRIGQGQWLEYTINYRHGKSLMILEI
ncbi:Membrane-bound transcription factor site-2 protease [Linnemannia zychae]|nr:Membrane-bound transcription factor site-2 protease [Linnemannia zychae]